MAAKSSSKHDSNILLGSLEAKLLQKDSSPRQRELVLIVLGEIGKSCDISTRETFDKSTGAVIKALEARGEGERCAAAQCFGSVASLNIAATLPTILLKCQTQGQREIALAALKRMLILCATRAPPHHIGKSDQDIESDVSMDHCRLLTGGASILWRAKVLCQREKKS